MDMSLNVFTTKHHNALEKGSLLMKKLFKSILSFLTSALLIVCLTVPAFATTPEKTIHYYNDGSYLIETVSLEMPAISLCSTNKTKSKTATYYSKSNIAQWEVTVTGTFSYGNGSATCTASSVTTKSYVTDWKISSKSSSKSGNSATATATAIEYLRGHEVQRKTLSTTLSCSPNGTLY